MKFDNSDWSKPLKYTAKQGRESLESYVTSIVIASPCFVVCSLYKN